MTNYFSYKSLAGIFLIFALMVSISSCNTEEEIESEDVSDDTLAVSKWVYEGMSAYYLWNDEISSSIDYEEEEYPDELFDKMLYPDEDKWSWITDDWTSLEEELDETKITSMGFAPAFFYKNNASTDIITIVKYVYEDSPAEEAGLQRGDIILTYNGEVPNDQNYYDLFSEGSYTVGLGSYSSDDDYFSSTGETVNLEAESFYANPIIHYEVTRVNGHKIGYLVYSDFSCGVNDKYLDSLDVVMDYFSDKNATDVIVDLRYNSGGEIEAASYLASALAPESVVADEKVFLGMTYNSILQSYFENLDDDNNLHYRFSEGETNFDLSTVYFLTTSETSAASELLIAGLQPYMNVVVVGDSTAGKYIGSWIIPEEDYDWCMVPVVLKYENADGYTDFKDGIVPDVYVYDNLLPTYEFGDLDDEVFATAIEQITGTQVSSSKSSVIQTENRELIPRNSDSGGIIKVVMPDNLSQLRN